MSHTEGAWKATGNGVHTGTHCVATTHMEPKDQRDADARLIAAAPDLLDALKDVREWIAGWDPAFTNDPDWEESANRIDSAIDKAEGR